MWFRMLNSPLHIMRGLVLLLQARFRCGVVNRIESNIDNVSDRRRAVHTQQRARRGVRRVGVTDTVVETGRKFPFFGVCS